MLRQLENRKKIATEVQAGFIPAGISGGGLPEKKKKKEEEEEEEKEWHLN